MHKILCKKSMRKAFYFLARVHWAIDVLELKSWFIHDYLYLVTLLFYNMFGFIYICKFLWYINYSSQWSYPKFKKNVCFTSIRT